MSDEEDYEWRKRKRRRRGGGGGGDDDDDGSDGEKSLYVRQNRLHQWRRWWSRGCC